TIEPELLVPKPSIESLTQIIKQATTIESAERKSYAEETLHSHIKEDATTESPPTSPGDVTNRDEVEHVKSTTVIQAPSSDIVAELNEPFDKLQTSLKTTPSEENPEDKNEEQKRHDEQISMQPLTEALPEILTTSAAPHQPTVEQILLEATKNEHILETPTIPSITETTKTILIVTPTELTVLEEEKIKPADLKDEELQHPIVTSSNIQISDEIIQDDPQKPVTESTTKPADHVSTEALTEAPREIIAIPVTLHQPIDTREEVQAIENQTIVEEPSSETIIELNKQLQEIESSLFGTPDEEKPAPVDIQHDDKQQLHTTPTNIETTEDITTQVQQPAITEPTTELADHVSTDALTEAVREIIAKPLIADMPTEQQQTTQASSLSSIIEIPTFTELTTTPEETIQPVDVKQQQLQQAIATSPHSGIVDQITMEKQQPVFVEPTTEVADRVSTQALTEAVREIIATPLIAKIPTKEHVEERTIETEAITKKSSSETIGELKTEIESSLFQTPDEGKPESMHIQHDDEQQLSTIPTNLETTEDITTQVQQPGITEPPTELADDVSTEALTEVVREIIARSAIADIPTEENVEQKTVESPTIVEIPAPAEIINTHEEIIEP
ncbi:unnamed protein product, partial [Rotaria socialis]